MDCLFCTIIARELPSTLLYEDEELIAFSDIAPQAPVHILIVPKKHYASILEVDDYALPGKMIALAQKLAKEQGLAEKGFRLIMNTGAEAGQSVQHLHMHLLGGRELSLTMA